MAPVKGRITCNGKPVHDAAVIFSPLPRAEGDRESGKAAQAGTDADGRYVLSTFKPGDGALVGSHKVSVVVDNATPIPCKIKVVTRDVVAGDNEVNIELNQ
jgi:hypothetical protein